MKKQSVEHVSVAIIGAGPVGLALGSALRSHGVETRIFERNETTTKHSKAIGMHARTLEAMHCLGVTEKLIEQGRPLHGFRVTDMGSLTLNGTFSRIDSLYNFVLAIPQSSTERILREQFESQGSNVAWGAHLVAIDDDGASSGVSKFRIADSTGNERTLTCDWLIGADGGKSTVRELNQIPFPGGSYGKAFIVGDVEIDWDGSKEELQFFLSKTGYLLVIPMPGGLHRIIAQTEIIERKIEETARTATTLGELQRVVDSNGPGGIKVRSPRWLTAAPFYYRLAPTPRKGRTLLVGDAFHLFSPLGAQGLNTGFQDAFNLAWKLAFVEKRIAPESLIDSYCAERLAMAEKIAAITKKTTQYITETRPFHMFLRKILTLAQSNTDKVRDSLPTLLAGLRQSYGEESSLIDQKGDGPIRAGARVPHAMISYKDKLIPLASLIHGQKFSLIFMRRRADLVDVESHIDELTFLTEQLQHILQFILIAQESTEFHDHASRKINYAATDVFGTALNNFGNTAQSMALVRPDGYCALSMRQWDMNSIAQYFVQIGLNNRTLPERNLKGYFHA